MTDLLLSTKLYIPPPRPDLIPRSRLIGQMNTGLSRKLTLISAPAGYGKSTLLSAWVEQAEPRARIAWLSLDEGDNELTRFLTYFIAALQTIDSDIGQGVLVALQTPGAVNIEAVLTTLLNEIAEFPDEFVLILDDYHTIESQPIDQAITFIIEHLPTQMHLIIASRIDPSWPLPRMRSRGQMTEVRVDDLRFKPDEAAAFLNQAVGFDLSTEDIASLEARTEGWITGLQLAALSMQGTDDVQGFIRSFSGSNRYILDYLGEEVFSLQSQNVQSFLLQTSILKRMTGPLCDAITGNSDGERMLISLERGNLFVVPLDNERRWYRYHHLFADLLNRRLSQRYSDRMPELHKRASIWYQREGEIEDALHHAQASGDTERVVDILEEYWDAILFKGELAKLRHLLDFLGPEITGKSAPLSLAYCWIHHQTDADDAIPKHIKDIRAVLKAGEETENALQTPRLAAIPSQVEVMEANIALHRNQPEKAKAHAQKSIALIPDHLEPSTQGLLRGAANFRLALAHQKLGEYEAASALLLGVLEGLKAGQNYVGVSKTILQIVGLYQEAGETQAAIKLCEDTLRYIAEHGWEKIPPCGTINIILAGLQAETGDIEAAKQNLEIGRGLVEPIKTAQIVAMVNNVNEKLCSISPSSQPLIEPLSPREIEVLQLLTQGLSNREIGERLFLALSTVKGHNQNIFDKLQVQRRTEAVARARELGLV